MKFTKYRSSKLVFIVFLIILLGSGIVSARDYNGGLYFLDSINVKGAKELLENKDLKISYIINLDNGIDKKLYDFYHNKVFVAADSIDINHNYFNHPWSGYNISNNHGTEITWPMLEIINALGFKTSPVKIISYKVSYPDGRINAENLYFALNNIIENLLKKEDLNIAAINFSSGVNWSRPELEEQKNQINQVEEKINEINNYGISFVAASGNLNSYIRSQINYFENTLVVGGVDINNNRYVNSFEEASSYGKPLDLVAPAIGIKVGYNNGNINKTGTSYSAPMVSTTIALMKSINPNLTPQEIKNILAKTSKDLNSTGKDIYFGHGLLDMGEAVKKALQ